MFKVNPTQIQSDVTRALAEDVGTGDISASLLPEHKVVHAELISREPMLVCGLPWVEAVFAALDKNIRCEWHVTEGQWLDKPCVLGQIEGVARAILTAERTALNFLQTLSGTATLTHRCAAQLKGYKTKLLDTRKTLPGLRVAQKYAVLCGGGYNHRMGLFDAFLIKENHIAACGSIQSAISCARKMELPVMLEIEVENLVELKEALDAAPDRILLDNFSTEMLQDAVSINQSYGCELEVSGGITIDNLAPIAATGVDFISMGSLTKSVQAIDLSLLIREIL